jgi:Flp pilus assembly protein TadG
MRSTRRHPAGRGQAMVEFALALPLLMLLLLGLADFARAVYYYNVLSSAAREGAREAVLSYNQCQNTGPCTTVPAGASLVGVDNAVTRAGGGIMTFDFTGATQGGTQGSPAVNQTPACTPQPNRGCAWVFLVGTGDVCRNAAGTDYTGPGPTDEYSLCDFNQFKTGGHYDVVVETEFKFQAFTPLIGNLIANGGVMWAKSEMRTEY